MNISRVLDWNLKRELEAYSIRAIRESTLHVQRVPFCLPRGHVCERSCLSNIVGRVYARTRNLNEFLCHRTPRNNKAIILPRPARDTIPASIFPTSAKFSCLPRTLRTFFQLSTSEPFYLQVEYLVESQKSISIYNSNKYAIQEKSNANDMQDDIHFVLQNATFNQRCKIIVIN